MKKKQIVFVNQSAGYLMIDIINAFEDEYEEIILFTGLLNPRNKKLNSKIKVEKLALYDRTSTVKRLLSWGKAFAKSWYLINFKYSDADLFLVSNPPMATLLPIFCKNKFSLLIYDIYPDALVQFKIFKPNSFIINAWKKANINIFVKANRLFTITDGMKEKLTQYVNKNKIEVVPIWTDNDFLKPIPKSENIFLKSLNLQDKFVVMYSGNLGKSHPIEILVEIATELKNTNEINFLIIGQGDKFEMINQKIKNAHLNNIKLLPWQPTDLLPYTLSGADLAIVSLGNEASDLSIPSKTYNLMSVGVPILCIANQNSALSRLIEKHEIGKSFSADNKSEIIDYILESYLKISLKQMQENSLNASLIYTPNNAKLFLDV